ncbi:hypothetical protein [Haliangium sp.]|uniref:hypothetical protein n=1 Tax=Haliangium sp. TaxID=2663208 RepID=UPI003D12992D
MHDLLRLDGIWRSRRQISLAYSAAGLRFTTSYWYRDLDLIELERRYGEDFMGKLYFHMLAFEANKAGSLKPARLDPGPFGRYLSDRFVDLWSRIFHKVWAQWRYENELPDYPGPAITAPAERADIGARALAPGDVDLLAFCGGGKDSLVCMGLLDEAGAGYGLFEYAHSIYGTRHKQEQLVGALAAHGAPVRVHRQWVADDFLDSPVLECAPDVGVRSLTAAETPSSIFAAVPVALAHGYRYLVLGHERSADTGNLIWDRTGEDVNHQWGKSGEAEDLLNRYLQDELVSNLAYFSLLKPIHDVVIFGLLRDRPDGLEQTHSCNLDKPWCKRCPKCAYVWLNYMAYLPVERVDAMFGQNLFDLPENQLAFRQMLGLEAHTPFECLGQVEEARLAFELCRAKGLGGAAMDAYRSAAPALDVDAVLDRFARVYEPSADMPKNLRGPVLARMREAAERTAAYVRQTLAAAERRGS